MIHIVPLLYMRILGHAVIDSPAVCNRYTLGLTDERPRLVCSWIAVGKSNRSAGMRAPQRLDKIQFLGTPQCLGKALTSAASAAGTSSVLSVPALVMTTYNATSAYGIVQSIHTGRILTPHRFPLHSPVHFPGRRTGQSSSVPRSSNT